MTTHHHEEEHDLFPAVRRLMSDVTLKTLGAKMQALFEANLKRGHEAVLATFDDELKKLVRAKMSPRAKTVKHLLTGPALKLSGTGSIRGEAEKRMRPDGAVTSKSYLKAVAPVGHVVERIVPPRRPPGWYAAGRRPRRFCDGAR